DLEARTARRSQAAASDPSGDRRCLTRLERRDRLKTAAIFVAKGKAIQQIFDGDQAGALEIRSTPRTDALEELKRRRQKGVRPLFAHCTIMAWPRSTWISRMRAGSANGSSRPMPDGLSLERV